MPSPKQTSQSHDDYLPAGEAAKLAHMSTSTLARAADRGDVVTIKTPGGQRRYLRSSVLELITPDQAAS